MKKLKKYLLHLHFQPLQCSTKYFLNIYLNNRTAQFSSVFVIISHVVGAMPVQRLKLHLISKQHRC